MKKIFLVDVSSMFFRAFYAVRELTSPAGVPVNAIYGFLTMVVRLLKEEKPEYLVFCYDRKEPSFRKDIYVEYKANRTEMPNELEQQIPYIKKLPALMGIPELEMPSYEADDLIGALTKISREQGFEVVIVSGDKDFAQLLNEHVLLYDTMKEQRYDSKAVFEKWGVHPHQFLDYLSLVGDASDNIPGVDGIGTKTAAKLLAEYSNLDTIYDKIDQVKPAGLQEKLRKNKENAYLSKTLVKIVTELPLSKNMQDYHIKSIDRKALGDFLRELNFKSLEKSLLGENTANMVQALDAKSSPVEIKHTEISITSDSAKSIGDTSEPLEIQNLEEAKKIFHHSKLDEVCIFFERDNLYLSTNSKIYCWYASFKEFKTFLQTEPFKLWGFDLKKIAHRIFPLWEDGEINLIGETWSGDDLMLMAYTLRPKDCSEFNNVYEQWTSKKINDLPSAIQIFKAHLELRQVLQHELQAKGLLNVYVQLDLPLWKILFEMERLGIKIDTSFLKEQSQDLESEIRRLEKSIIEMAGESFNVASPKQLAQILFVKMGLESSKKTKTGFSTDNDVLEKLNHPIAQEVLKYRELSKLKSTYVDALPLVADIHGRVHTSFNQALTATGRLSSTQPNLQNIPVRTTRGQKIRQAFVAESDKKFLSLDYSQIELRILAHFSQDINLCEAFALGHDVHARTAAEIYGVELSQVTDEQRRNAKAVNFGIAYGQGAFGLAENLGISRGESQKIITAYFNKFPGVKNYIEQTIVKAHEQGFVETLAGRRRYIDELKSKNPAIKKFGERAAINAPIQGTASDLVKKAMIDIQKYGVKGLLLQVHDELLFELSENEIHKHKNKLIEIMESVIQLRVPLKINAGIGKNWDTAH